MVKNIHSPMELDTISEFYPCPHCKGHIILYQTFDRNDEHGAILYKLLHLNEDGEKTEMECDHLE
jgi:hypothetical protein